jgi:hypothetical protein
MNLSAQWRRDGEGMLTVDEKWAIIIKHEVLATGTDNLFEIGQSMESSFSHYEVS